MTKLLRRKVGGKFNRKRKRNYRKQLIERRKDIRRGGVTVQSMENIVGLGMVNLLRMMMTSILAGIQQKTTTGGGKRRKIERFKGKLKRGKSL